MNLRRLGRSPLEVSAIGLGCWQFSSGAGPIGSYWAAPDPAVINDIVAASLAGGINWFDTAEAYGWGNSERALTRALQTAGKKPGDVVIATKWWPLARTARSIEGTFAARESSLAPFSIDLHQIHAPVALSSTEAQAAALGRLLTGRRVRAVGVSNFGARRMRAMHDALAGHGAVLATNQMRYSLVDRRIERNGVLQTAKELGITVIAYSPLGQGLLSGRFHDDPGAFAGVSFPRRLQMQRLVEKSRPLITQLKAIAQAHGASPAQVALAWLLQAHGDVVVAIPGATKRAHVETNVGAMGLILSERERTTLDEGSRAFL